MKKRKLFSYLFMGLLAVGATGTVTSCKDYDDDINAANERIDGLTATINELKTQHAADIQALKDAQAEYATKIALRDTASALRAYADAAAAQAKADADANALALAQQYQTTINNRTDANIQALKDQLEALIATKANQSDYESLLAQVNAINDSENGILAQAKVALQAEIAAINTELGKKLDTTTFDQKVTELEKADADLKSTVDGIVAQLASYNDLEQQAAAFKTFKEQIDGMNLTGKFADLDAKITALQTTVDGLQQKVLDSQDFKDLKTNMTTAQTAITTLQGTTEELDKTTKANAASITTITNQLNVLNVLVENKLTSLVYKAEKYALSFPEVEVATFDCLPTYTVDLTDLTKEPVTEAQTTKSYAPNVIAKYWMNPSSANYQDYNYKFVDLETTNETRGHDDPTLCVDNNSLVPSAEGGVLTINFKVNAANVNTAITKDVDGQKLAWLSTIALQASKKSEAANAKDTTITSDYALLIPTWYKDLKLGNNDNAAETTHEQGNKHYHLNTTLANTKTEDAAFNYSFILPYVGDSTVILNNKIDLHYAYSANNTDFTQDHVWTNAEAQQRGFTFKYTMLPTETVDGKAQAPAAYTIKGDTVTVAKKGDRSGVGSEAIVLVEMQADGVTVAYGYVSFLISNNAITYNEKLGELTLNCPEPFEAKASYTELVDTLAKQLGITTAQFNQYYTFVGGDDNVTKYAKGDGTDAATEVGTVKKVGNDLVWSFTENEVKKTFYTQNATTKKYEANNVNEYSTWIAFKSTNQTLAPDFRIQVTIPAIHRPAGLFAYDNRIRQYWYVAGKNEIAATPEARAEIHANVEVVGQPNADDELNYDISSTYMKNVFAIDRAAANPAFTYDTLAVVNFDASAYPCEALGATGAKYTLKLNDAATEIYAEAKDGTDELVAKLSGTYNNIVEFQHGKYAEDLLNVASHTVLDPVAAKDPAASTFTTHMVLTDNGTNCLPIALTGATKFDVRYLRPIDGVASDAAEAYDAVDNGNRIWLADLVSFRDWRWTESTTQYAFGGANGTNRDMTYINYYGITEIKPDLSKVRTNINGRDQLLSDVTNKITLSDTDPATGASSLGTYTKNSSSSFNAFRTAIGYIYYGNVGSTVSDFYLDIPVTVKYDWGETAPATIRINVKSTQGNAKRR